MTTFKVGDVVTPKNEKELKTVIVQLDARGRKLPYPPHFKVSKIGCVGSVAQEPILYYECGYHTYAKRMQLVVPLDRPLDHYM